MSSLMGSSGANVDRHVLPMLISHDRGAVEMARTQQAQGSDPDTKALAATIIEAPTAAIAQMQTPLTQA